MLRTFCSLSGTVNRARCLDYDEARLLHCGQPAIVQASAQRQTALLDGARLPQESLRLVLVTIITVLFDGGPAVGKVRDALRDRERRGAERRQAKIDGEGRRPVRAKAPNESRPQHQNYVNRSLRSGFPGWPQPRRPSPAIDRPKELVDEKDGEERPAQRRNRRAASEPPHPPMSIEPIKCVQPKGADLQHDDRSYRNDIETQLPVFGPLRVALLRFQLVALIELPRRSRWLAHRNPACGGAKTHGA